MGLSNHHYLLPIEQSSAGGTEEKECSLFGNCSAAKFG